MSGSLVTDKQFYILLALGAGVVFYARHKAIDIAEAVNPLNDENVFYQGTNELFGENNVAAVSDHIFGAFDLLNPWASEERKRYAATVWGLSNGE